MLTRVTENSPGQITEQAALRALSHPTRWAIVDLLGLERTATATRCAEVTGESVASCSYHLGMLAKYGLVEQAEGGQGREKPWKLTSSRQSWSLDDMDTEGALAVETLTEVYIDHHAARMKDHVRRSSREAPEWRRNAGSFATTTYLSAAEMAELAAEFQTIVARYQDRIEDPSLRPEGSRPVRMLLTAWLPRPPA
ncbi:MAG: hypothetical protein QOG20_5969 [Pseudonocardiales bacterium]|nr:hypothetical protein [Pseudonocardiales bacterium]